MMNTNTKIKRIMAKKEISQSELCKLSGISKSTLSEILSGKYEPSKKHLQRLADAMGVTVDEINAEGDVEIPNERPLKVSTAVAGKLLGIGKPAVVAGIKHGTLPIGHVIGEGTTRTHVYISSYKLEETIGRKIWD